MGEKYIKTENGKEVVYERGFLGDTKVGEVKESWFNPGGKDIHGNIFEGKVGEIKDKSFWSDEREATIRDEKGVFKKGFFDNTPTFHPSREEKTYSSSGGGGYSGGGYSSESSDIGWLAPFIIIILLITLIGSMSLGLSGLVAKVETGIIQNIYPAYETREEQALREKQEWQRWENFAQGSKKWLLISEIAPTMPDKKITFLSQIEGKSTIYLRDIKNGNQTELVQGLTGIIHYAVSLDGEKIIFDSVFNLLNRSPNQEIYIIDSNGSNLMQLTLSYGGKNPVWFSDSKIIFVYEYGPYQSWILLKDALRKLPEARLIPGAHTTDKKRNRNFEEYTHPVASPDGKQIAFIKNTRYIPFVTPLNLKSEFFIYDISKHKEIPLFSISLSGPRRAGSNEGICLSSQAWSPDGSKIVFSVRDKDGKSKIGILELKETMWKLSQAKISWLRITGNNPVWSPDGKWIAFDNQEEAYIFEIATGNIGRVAKGTKPLWFP